MLLKYLQLTLDSTREGVYMGIVGNWWIKNKHKNVIEQLCEIYFLYLSYWSLTLPSKPVIGLFLPWFAMNLSNAEENEKNKLWFSTEEKDKRNQFSSQDHLIIAKQAFRWCFLTNLTINRIGEFSDHSVYPFKDSNKLHSRLFGDDIPYRRKVVSFSTGNALETNSECVVSANTEI